MVNKTTHSDGYIETRPVNDTGRERISTKKQEYTDRFTGIRDDVSQTASGRR